MRGAYLPPRFGQKVNASAKGWQQQPLHFARFNDICASPRRVCAQRINCCCYECIMREKVSRHFLCLLLLCFASWKAISSGTDCASRGIYSHSHTPNSRRCGERNADRSAFSRALCTNKFDTNETTSRIALDYV